jgi:DNA-binding protein HU-beta
VNKQELLEAVAKALATSKAHAGEIVDLFFSAEGLIAKELKQGGSVNLTGFGSFEVRKRAAREGRNPQTGATIKIKASKVPAFRPGKGFKDVVNKAK